MCPGNRPEPPTEVGFHCGKLRCFESEGKLVVERAELAAVVRASRSCFQYEGIGLIGRPPDCSRVVHDVLLASDCLKDGWACRIHHANEALKLEVLIFFVVHRS